MALESSGGVWTSEVAAVSSEPHDRQSEPSPGDGGVLSDVDEAKHGATQLGLGAGESAPTAPHATPSGPRKGRKRTGPERFWDSRRARLVLLGMMFASILIHVSPPFWSALLMFLDGTNVQFHEADADLLIPADLLDDPTAGQTPVGPAPVPVPTVDTTGETPGQKPPDAGARRDAAPNTRDAGVADAEGPADEGGMIASYVDDDAGAGDGGAFGRDPSSLLGGVGAVASGTNKVTVLVNFQVIKTHPLGPRIAPLLMAIPEWKQFMTGTSIDPYRDTDWMLITGPSLIHTEKDAVFIHYSVADADVDKAVEAVAAQYAKGGKIDLGVPGTKAWRGYAHGAERTFVRPSSHFVMIVPPANAAKFAAAYRNAGLKPRFRKGEALSVEALEPGGSVNVFPQSISKLRMWVVPRDADGGGDLYVEGDCPDAAAASAAATELKKTVQQKNSMMVRLVTNGLLDGFDTSSDGPMMKAHLSASKEQIESILGLVGGFLGVAPPASSTTTAPLPPPPPLPPPVLPPK
jgi:hypothetical protein